MSKVVVIGAGASGISASLKCSENNEVILLEGNNKIGKKISITGNGKCNYWNDDINIKNYYTDNYDLLESILNNKDEVYNYLLKLGIYPHVKNGYYYPASNQAASVVEIFNREIIKRNIEVKYNFKVTNIEKNNNKFVVSSNEESIECDKVIVSAGALSYHNTGSDGSGFDLLKKYHTINKTYPALVPLRLDTKFVKEWANVRVEASVSVNINGKEYKDTGEVQLTDYGVSGIPVFNISSIISKNIKNDLSLKINFLPNIDNVYTFMDERNKLLSGHTISELLETVLPYQLVNAFIKTSKLEDKYWDKISNKEKEELVELLSNNTIHINSTLSYDKSQVTTGGVPLNEIDINIFESKKVNGLYVVGELLDVDGKCGGFNLSFAFITGYLAGKSIK